MHVFTKHFVSITASPTLECSNSRLSMVILDLWCGPGVMHLVVYVMLTSRCRALIGPLRLAES